MVEKKKSSEKSVNISKGIILGFFTIYLIFYGIGLSLFAEDAKRRDPTTIAWYLGYLPYLCYIAAAIVGVTFISFIRSVHGQKSRETKSRKKIKSGSIYKQAIFLIIFIFAFIPLLSPIIDQGKNTNHFSVYNDEWHGGSEFKATLEDEGFEVMTLQSSLSAAERLNNLNKSIALILFGTNSFYNPLNEIPYFIDFFDGEPLNSIAILHDHGSTSFLLIDIAISEFISTGSFTPDKVPITLFPDGILHDNDSCITKNGKKDPEFPIITRFEAHPITQGIDRVILSRATTTPGGEFASFSGWDLIGRASDYSFIDKNGDHRYDPKDDNIDFDGDSNLIENAIGSKLDDLGLSGLTSFPLGGIPQPVFMAKETDYARFFIAGDASMFNNELILERGYDNKQFGINIVKWLTYEDKKTPNDWIVVFDEAHIRPEQSRDLSSSGIFGYIIQYIVHLSTNPITAWIYPLLAIFTLNRYLPKKNKQEEERKKAAAAEKKEEKEKFRTSSFFSKKINYYHEKSRYEKPLVLLYRRLERKINAQLGGLKITTQNVIDFVNAKEGGINRTKERRIQKFMDKILVLKEGKGRRSKVKNEKDFEELFFEMEWIMNNI